LKKNLKSKINLGKDIRDKLELINIVMDRFLPRKDDYPKEVHKALRHSLFAGGKRIRPYLALLVYQVFNTNITNEVLMAMSAIELLHTYTLIHDDLPEIDNDDYRRGKKTCHVVFGSNIALLVGDALMVESFNMINSVEIDPVIKIKLLSEITSLSGETGLIAGQMKDILTEGKKFKLEDLEYIHLNKTAKLIQVCTRFGAILGGASETDFNKFDEYGKKLGLAFQIIDDILDVEGITDNLGKTTGKDADKKKATYPALFSVEKAKEIANKYSKEAMDILEGYGQKTDLLKELTMYLISRQK
jgi:geranylgeranyl diphosphate synthase type II